MAGQGKPVKYIGLTQDEAEAVLDSGYFKIRTNSATRAFVVKLLSIILEFETDTEKQILRIDQNEHQSEVK